MVHVPQTEIVNRLFKLYDEKVEECYEIANRARKKGYDPEPFVEIPKAEDLALRVEKLLSYLNIGSIHQRIRDLSAKHPREVVAIKIAVEIAKNIDGTLEEKLDKAIRVGLGILTEGILVAPLEGLTEVKLLDNFDGSKCCQLFFSGPIRSAGGTAQALSVLIADIVRKELKLDRYKPTEEEVERYIEEIGLYKSCGHLQYMPTPEEIRLIVSNCPVCIDGEPTEDVMVSGHRNLPRIKTNNVRGGMALVIAEGLCLKASKVQSYVEKLKIEGWEFISEYIKLKKIRDRKSVEQTHRETPKYLKEALVGRPILCHPSKPGGFRLRYGRSRATGLAALAINPATMHLLDDFLAIGTQIKIEFPGKAGVITCCDTIEGPRVLLSNGDFIQINNSAEALKYKNEIVSIVDLGEILVSVGEFFENKYPLQPPAYSVEWWLQEFIKNSGKIPVNEFDKFLIFPDAFSAFKLSEDYNIPLHPSYNLFWHDLNFDEINRLSTYIENNGRWFREFAKWSVLNAQKTENREPKSEGNELHIPEDPEIKNILLKLGACYFYEKREEKGIFRLTNYGYPLLRCLGLDVIDNKICRVRELHERVTSDELRVTSDELRVTNDELRVTNDELRVTNGELSHWSA